MTPRGPPQRLQNSRADQSRESRSLRSVVLVDHADEDAQVYPVRGWQVLLSPCFPYWTNFLVDRALGSVDFGLAARKPSFCDGTLFAPHLHSVAATDSVVSDTTIKRDRMTVQYMCHRCSKTARIPSRCCGEPMTRASLDEGIFWPLMWLPPQGEGT